MPLQQELPESLQPLARRQALSLSDTNFARDVQDLIAALEKGQGHTMLPRRTPKSALITAALLLVVIAVGLWKWHESKSLRDGSASQSAATGASAPSTNPSPASASTDISGNWKAVLSKSGSRFNVLFTFEVSGERLFGRVVYPTGEAGIQNGTIKNGQLSFITRHTPQFADHEATITVDGRISGGDIEIVMQDDDGFAKGIAHRVPQSETPKQ